MSEDTIKINLSDITIPVSLSDLKILAGLLEAETMAYDGRIYALWLVQGMISKSVLPPRTPEEERELERIYDAEWYDIQVKENAAHVAQAQN